MFNKLIIRSYNGGSTGTDWPVTRYFSRVGKLCLHSQLGWDTLYLKFHLSSTTLYSTLDFANLVTVLLWISAACRLHFLSSPILLLSCLENLGSCPG